MLPVLKSRIVPSVTKFLDDDWNSLFDWSNQGFSRQSMSAPSTNVRETEDDFIVEMAAPGMKKEDFQIEINNDVLTIKSETKNESENQEENNYTRREFSYQSFQRSFTLNNRVVDNAKIKATYVDGILQLTIPKKEEAKVKPPIQIKIK
jgi:HSP20 family protein